MVGVSIQNRGYKYSITPTIVISGGGSPGVITGVFVGNQASGYTPAPTATITGGGGTGATATANIFGGKVVSINSVNEFTENNNLKLRERIDNHHIETSITISFGNYSVYTFMEQLNIQLSGKIQVSYNVATNTYNYTNITANHYHINYRD